MKFVKTPTPFYTGDYTCNSVFLWPQQITSVAFSALLMCASINVNANDDPAVNDDDVIALATLPPSFPIMNIVADETVRRLEADGIRIERILPEATPEQIRQNPEPELLLAGLDAFITQWDDLGADDAMSAGKLLDSLVPVAEIVRDHQAFLMMKTRNAQELRSRFAKAHGAAGPMSIGGLTPKGHRDHLVAMMLMDAVGQDSTLYPYRQYESRESLALGLLTGEVQIASMPVSQALQMSLEGGITIIATSGANRQDVMTNVPTLTSARIDMRFTNYIGLYRPGSVAPDEKLQSVSSFVNQFSDKDWPERVYQLGLVDDYINEGTFAVNVLRELARLKRFAQMLE